MSAKSAPAAAPEFSRPIDVSELEDGEEGERHVVAEADERAALSRRFGLVGIDSLVADLTYARHGHVIAVKGHLAADVTQTCVVTLEPLKTRIDEDLAIKFDPDLAVDDEEQAEISAEELLDEDDVQALVGDEIDLGEVVAECLGLALDPYPRKEGSEIDPRYATGGGEAASEANPFAVLKKLKL
jgi:uncharacterized metal-binding protein YceD (DUF177 family)